MEYLHSRYGDTFMRRLHRSNANGLAGVERVLARQGVTKSTTWLLNRWAAMVAVDGRIDANGGNVVGAAPRALTAKSLRSVLNWRTEEAYGDDGAPANGSDYVRLRDGADAWLPADEVTSVSFAGAPELPAAEMEWVLDQTPPDAVPAGDESCGETDPGSGPAALYSGCGAYLDRSVAREVTVPAGSPTLSFEALWDIETDYDFAFVQVSDDGGETWTSLATDSTTTDHADDVSPATVALLPGLSGSSDGWQTETADLTAYAGETVLLSFRYVTDPLAHEAGLWVRDVSVGGQAVSTDLADWATQTQLNPLDVDSWTVQLVAYGTSRQPVHYHRMRLDAGHTGELTGAALRRAIGDDATTVAAIVTQNDPDESSPGAAMYRLEVDGVQQPGGGPFGP
jgi:hypothetical protein